MHAALTQRLCPTPEAGLFSKNLQPDVSLRLAAPPPRADAFHEVTPAPYLLPRAHTRLSALAQPVVKKKPSADRLRDDPVRLLIGASGTQFLYHRDFIGKGSYRKAYAAYDATLGEPCVLLKFAMGGSATQRRRIETELDAMQVAGSVLLPTAVLLRDHVAYYRQPLMQTDFMSVAQLLAEVQCAEERAQLRRLVALVLLREIGAQLARLHGHSRPYVHRDVKPDNIMFDGKIHLADFDFAALVTSKELDHAGTPTYAAPEVLLRTGRPTQPADVWSLASTVLPILVGRDNPFAVPESAKTLTHRGRLAHKLCVLRQRHAEYAHWYPHRHGQWWWPLPINRFAAAVGAVNEPLRSLLLDMMHPEPSERPSIAAVLVRLQHPSLTLSDAEEMRVNNYLLSAAEIGGIAAVRLRPLRAALANL